jgi:hypothetical protein
MTNPLVSVPSHLRIRDTFTIHMDQQYFHWDDLAGVRFRPTCPTCNYGLTVHAAIIDMDGLVVRFTMDGQAECLPRNRMTLRELLAWCWEIEDAQRNVRQARHQKVAEERARRMKERARRMKAAGHP